MDGGWIDGWMMDGWMDDKMMMAVKISVTECLTVSFTRTRCGRSVKTVFRTSRLK